jgi:hypothetical protein
MKAVKNVDTVLWMVKKNPGLTAWYLQKELMVLRLGQVWSALLCLEKRGDVIRTGHKCPTGREGGYQWWATKEP